MITHSQLMAAVPGLSGIKFRRAGSLPGRFGVDGKSLFWGYHGSDHRRNGWVMERFRRGAAGLTVDWVYDGQSGTAWREGVVLCLRSADADEAQRVEPDELGLYSFDGWAWSELADDDQA